MNNPFDNAPEPHDPEVPNPEQLITGDTARELLDNAGLEGLRLDQVHSSGDARANIVYYDGGSTGGEIDLPSGGTICEHVPISITPLFVASPELAKTVEHYDNAIQRIQDYLAVNETITATQFNQLLNS